MKNKDVFITKCPDCGKRARFLRFLMSGYGWETTCLRCGRNWQNDEWMPLCFEPKSRPKSIERAKRHWRKLRIAEVYEGVKISE